MSTKKPVVAQLRWNEPTLTSFDAHLRARASVLQRPAGAVLFRTGERLSRMFYVRNGEVQMHRVTPSGTPILLQRTSRGFIAEASLTSAKYHCDAVCSSPCELLAFPVHALREAIDSDEGTRWAWIGLLSAQSRQLRTQIERRGLKTVAERLMHLIHAEGAEGRFDLRGTRKELAAELGVTPEALYRTLAALQADGSLSIDGERLQWRGSSY